MTKLSSEERGRRIAAGLARMSPEAKQAMIDKCRPHRALFFKTHKMSPESIAKRALKLKGRKVSEETKEKLRLLYKGKPRPDFQKEKNPMWKGGDITLRSRRLSRLEKIVGRKKPEECEICGASGIRICFDHDHKSGQFRGWICRNCNLALGFAKDDVGILSKLITYLSR